MYYDELLVGTGTGLYAHDVFSATTSHTQEVRVEAQAFPTSSLTLVVRTPSEGQVALLDLTGRVVVQDTRIATEAQRKWAICLQGSTRPLVRRRRPSLGHHQGVETLTIHAGYAKQARAIWLKSPTATPSKHTS